jgi:hypothetical protein
VISVFAGCVSLTLYSIQSPSFTPTIIEAVANADNVVIISKVIAVKAKTFTL